MAKMRKKMLANNSDIIKMREISSAALPALLFSFGN
jgi:hypothetical protein